MANHEGCNVESTAGEREDFFNRAIDVLGIDKTDEAAVAAVRAQAVESDEAIFQGFANLVEQVEASKNDPAAELRQDGVAFVRDNDEVPAVDLGFILGVE